MRELNYLLAIARLIIVDKGFRLLVDNEDRLILLLTLPRQVYQELCIYSLLRLRVIGVWVETVPLL
jgi:hypothetical protein